MELYIGVDGTGRAGQDLAEDLLSGMIEEMAARNMGSFSTVVGYPLFRGPAIACANRNCAQAFSAYIHDADYQGVARFVTEYVAEHADADSAPGVCLAKAGEIAAVDTLISYGQRARKEPVTKEEACEVAERAEVFLDEVGGSGRGVIGALAGVALLLSDDIEGLSPACGRRTGA